MNNLPPSYSFKGDKTKAISLKSEALQFSNFISSQAEKEGVNSISRKKILSDGSIISVISSKQSNYNNRFNSIKITSPISIKKLNETGVYCTYYYTALPTSLEMDGAIYVDGNTPPFSIPPTLGISTLINSNVDTLIAKNDKVYSTFNATSTGSILHNRQPVLGSISNTSGVSPHWDKVYSSDMTGSPLSVTGISGVVDAYYSSAYSMVCSLYQSADFIHIYLDKVVGDTITNKMDIYYEASPLTFTITTYHDTLGTVTSNKVSSLPTMTFFDNPRVWDARFSPDGAYLSILLQQRVASSPNSKMVVLDFVIKLDSNGVWADPNPSPAITYNISNDTSLVNGTPNSSNYLTAINNNVSYNISTFNYVESINRVKVISSTATTSGNHDFTHNPTYPTVTRIAYWARNVSSTDYTYNVISKGSSVVGFLYDSTITNTYYNRHWITLNYEFQDKTGTKVTGDVGITDNYDYTDLDYSALTGGISEVTMYDPGDISILSGFNIGRSLIRTYKRDARLVALVKLEGVIKGKILTQFDSSMEGVMDTDVITESKYTLDWTFDNSVGLALGYKYIYPINHYFIKTRSIQNNNSFFYDAINGSTSVGVFNYNKSIDFTSFRNTINTWNKKYEAVISANAYRFPNGVQITHSNAVVDYYSQVLNSNINTTITSLLGIVNTKETTSSTPASISTVQGVYTSIPAPSTTTTESRAIHTVVGGGNGIYIKMGPNSYLAWCNTNVSGSGRITNYLLINGVTIPQLININAFNNFPANQGFGIGFSI